MLIKKDYIYEEFIDTLQTDKHKLIDDLQSLMGNEIIEIRLKDKLNCVYILQPLYDKDTLKIQILRVKHKFASITADKKIYKFNSHFITALNMAQYNLHNEITLEIASDPDTYNQELKFEKSDIQDELEAEIEINSIKV